MPLSVSEREFFRKRVQDFIGKNPTFSKAEIVNHFVLEGVARRTMYSVLDKLGTSSSIKERKRTGRPSSWTSDRKKRLKRLTNNRCNVSQNDLAPKFNVNQSTICRQLAKMKITYRKREKAPKYTEEQAKRSRILSRKLYKRLRDENPSIVMDDEKYFLFSKAQYDGYYSIDKNSTPDSVRFLGQQKFPPKLLVWIAISEQGSSQPFFALSKHETINSEVYINECLQSRLLPFISKHHRDGGYTFWPDLARAHTSKAAIAWMKDNVQFVPPETNPPNVPQARPIENFWGCLSQKVYEGGWQAKTKEDLMRRIKQKLKEFDKDFFQRLMSSVKTKLNKIAKHGVFGPLK